MPHPFRAPGSWRRALPFLAWPRPTGAWAGRELLAGATVALMLLPQGMAYAALAGMPLVTGLYASVLPVVVALLWGASPRLGVGPTALTSLMVGAALSPLAAAGSADWVALAVWLSLIAGAAQLLLGLGRFGWLLNLVSSPVMAGFTQGAAWLILASQVPALLGRPGGFGSWLAAPRWDWESLAYGGGALAVLLAARRWWPRAQLAMPLVAVAAALAWATGYAARGGAVVGVLPQALPTLTLPSLLPPALLAELLVPALVIALMSFLEAASSAQADHRRAGTRWDENQELVGQGLGKIAAGFSGAFPTSASFSRSAIALHAGAQTAWATLFAAVLVVLALCFLAPALFHVPRAVLAAIVVAAVLGLVQPRVLWRLARISRPEAAIALATFALTVATAPRLYWGVVAGLLMALAHFLYHRLHPRIIEVGQHPDGTLRDRHLWRLPPLAAGTLALRMDAGLDFASANALERHIEEQAAQPGVRQVCLFAQPINRVDATGCEAFGRIAAMLAARGTPLHLSGLKLPVDTRLRQAGLLVEGPLLATWRTEAEAIAALRAAADKTAA